MIIGTDDVILSFLDYLATKEHEVKADDGSFSITTLRDAFPNAEILPRGLDFDIDTSGPRIGVRTIAEAIGRMYMGDGRDYDWGILVEVDGLIRDASGQPDPYATIRTVFRLKTSLRQILTEGARIPLHSWGPDGPGAGIGGAIVRRPRPFQATDDAFTVAVTLEKTIAL